MTPKRSNFSSLVGHATNLGVAVLGLLVVHEIAYQIAGWFQTSYHLHAPDHGHQDVLVAVAGPVALIAVGVVIIRQARLLGLTVSISSTQLACAIAGLYLAQESAEAMLSGAGLRGLVINKAVPVGFLIAPIVASVLVSLMTQAAELVRVWLTPEAEITAPVHRWLRAPGERFNTTVPNPLGRPRSPPSICV